METKQLSGILQENVLSLLLFSKDYGFIVRDSIPIEFWSGDSAFKVLLQSVYTYIDNYKSVPERHIFNLVEELNVSEEKKELLLTLVNSCELDFEGITPQFVMESLQKFHFHAMGEKICLQALELFQNKQGSKAFELIHDNLKNTLKLFDPGKRLMTYLIDMSNRSPDDDNQDKIELGIPELDFYNLVPKRKQLYLFGGIQNAGKSFFLTYVGIRALRQNKKVLHVTLELGDEPVLDRYMRGCFGYGEFPSKENSVISFMDGKPYIAKKNPCKVLKEPDTLIEAIDNVTENPYLNENLIVKEFPSVSLSITDLRAYLDGLELHSKFIPDILILDYADLMKAPNNNKRTDEQLQMIYRQLRAIAVERHLMVVTATQLTREASRYMKESDQPQKIRDYHVGQSYGKMQEADIALFYSQTDMQREYGMANLQITKARSAPEVELAITQDYNTGQFCLSSQPLNKQTRDGLKQIFNDLKTGLLVGT